VPDLAQRRQVEAMAAYGIPEPDISRVVGIDPKTLRKHYRDELDLGTAKANAQVAGLLFNSAKNGNVSAQIFWLKTRARWRETPLELQHSGSIGRKELSEYSDADLLAIISAHVPATPEARLEHEKGKPLNREVRGSLKLVRDVAEELVKRVMAESVDGRSLPYVLHLSDPPTLEDQMRLAACRLMRQPIAIMPEACKTVDEWVERHGCRHTG
jgi:hypothetical protein